MAEKKSNIPIYSLTIKELEEDYGISMMSFVEAPAVGRTFLALSEEAEKVVLKLRMDDELRIVTGVALRANYPIYRKHPKTGKEFYFTISPEEMLTIVIKFMRDGNGHKVNIDHDPNQIVDGVFLFESFILSDNHKLAYPEFADLEVGSWMVSYKVENDKVWNAIKKGLIKGFSVEIDGDLNDTQGQRIQDMLDALNLLTILEKS